MGCCCVLVAGQKLQWQTITSDHHSGLRVQRRADTLRPQKTGEDEQVDSTMALLQPQHHRIVPLRCCGGLGVSQRATWTQNKTAQRLSEGRGSNWPRVGDRVRTWSYKQQADETEPGAIASETPAENGNSPTGMSRVASTMLVNQATAYFFKWVSFHDQDQHLFSTSCVAGGAEQVGLANVASAALLISPFFFWGTSMVAMKVNGTPLRIY